MYMYGRPLENIQHLFLCGIEARLFGSIEEDEEYGYDYTLIDDSSA